MRFQNYKIIQMIKDGKWTDDSYYKCNTTGVMSLETKSIIQSNIEYLIKQNIKFKTLYRRYPIEEILPDAKPYTRKKGIVVSDMPLMKNCCQTCPFRTDRQNRMRDPALAIEVIQRNFMNSQQICHHPRIHGEEETHRCRGYFDYAEPIYQRLGYDKNKLHINGKSNGSM